VHLPLHAIVEHHVEQQPLELMVGGHLNNRYFSIDIFYYISNLIFKFFLYFIFIFRPLFIILFPNK
jgi:hypothetical protein